MSAGRDLNTVISDIEEILVRCRLNLNCLANKSVLITGGTGFIGSVLIKALDAANAAFGLNIKIIMQARSEVKAKSILADVLERITPYYSEAYVINEKCDFIIHTVSPTTSDFLANKPVETIDIMLSGTKAVLEMARKNASVLIYLSSMEEYGVPYNPGEEMSEEKVGVINHLSPRSCYPEGKRMCECMCSAYQHEFGVDARIVRLAQTFGTGLTGSDSRFAAQVARCVVENRDIILHTRGNSVSNYCYITDAIAGILVITDKGKAGNAYNVCNDTEFRTIKEIAEMAAADLANGRVSVRFEIDDSKGYAPDNTMRLKSEKLKGLGWTACVNLREGYRRLVKYYREMTEKKIEPRPESIR